MTIDIGTIATEVTEESLTNLTDRPEFLSDASTKSAQKKGMQIRQAVIESWVINTFSKYSNNEIPLIQHIIQTAISNLNVSTDDIESQLNKISEQLPRPKPKETLCDKLTEIDDDLSLIQSKLSKTPLIMFQIF